MRRIRLFLRTFGEKVENAVGFLRRNLLVPVPSVASVDELNARLRVGCERINSTSRNKFREVKKSAIYIITYFNTFTNFETEESK